MHILISNDFIDLYVLICKSGPTIFSPNVTQDITYGGHVTFGWVRAECKMTMLLAGLEEFHIHCRLVCTTNTMKGGYNDEDG